MYHGLYDISNTAELQPTGQRLPFPLCDCVMKASRLRPVFLVRLFVLTQQIHLNFIHPVNPEFTIQRTRAHLDPLFLRKDILKYRIGSFQSPRHRLAQKTAKEPFNSHTIGTLHFISGAQVSIIARRWCWEAQYLAISISRVANLSAHPFL